MLKGLCFIVATIASIIGGYYLITEKYDRASAWFALAILNKVVM